MYDKLTKSDIKKIKEVATSLLQKIKSKIAELDHWTDKQETKAAVDNLIRDTLWAELPECYDEISISESEWSVMEFLWSHPLSTITDIRKSLSQNGWSDSTIKTLVRRLVSKKAAAINDEGAVFRYYALLSEQECRLKETKSFINRVYNGSVNMLVTNLASESNLTEKETEELLRLIDKMGKE